MLPGAESGLPKQTYIPNAATSLEDGEQLDYDPSTYSMYHKLNVEFPCLSFDFCRDEHGSDRKKFPHRCTVVAGTQADEVSNNKLLVLGLRDMHKTKHDGDEDSDMDDSDSEDDDAVDDDPILESRHVKHTGGVNRVRCMPQNSSIVASWADTGRVYLWDLSQMITNVSRPKGQAPVPQTNDKSRPFHAFKGHKDEGFAMDWSSVVSGRLATGDCYRNIHTWQVASDGAVAVDEVPYKGHESSVEDLAWSPTEGTVFASCSVDQTVRIWDTRKRMDRCSAFTRTIRT